MSQHNYADEAPPADRRLLVLAGIVLAIPMVALIPVGWYSKYTPRINGFSFFIWYQMALVFICAICTSIAYVLVKKARPHVPLRSSDDTQGGE